MLDSEFRLGCDFVGKRCLGVECWGMGLSCWGCLL